MSNSGSTPAPSNRSEPKQKSGFIPMLLVGLLSTTSAAGIVLGAGYWLLHSGRLIPANGAAASKTPAGAEDGKKTEQPSKVLALEPMVVNLSDAGGRAYLRASISLRMAEPEAAKKEKAEEKPDAAAAGKTAALRDTTLSVLSAQTSDGLLSSDGVAAVKKNLRERYAASNPEVHVLDVYFTDFLVQRG